jgi:hypothetical protein
MRANHFALILGATSLAVVLLVSLAGHEAGYKSGFRLGQAEGWQAGENRFNKEWSKSGGDPAFSAQIRNAKLRWNKKSGLAPSEVDPNRIPVVMVFSDQVCVQLKLSSGSIGPSPAYCYRGETTELLRADDGGE